MLKTTDLPSYHHALEIAKVILYRKNKRAIKAKWLDAIRDMLHMEKK